LNSFVNAATTGNDIAVGDSSADVFSANASSADVFSADASSANASSNSDAPLSGRPKKRRVEPDQLASELTQKSVNSDADQLYSYQFEKEGSITEDSADELSDFDENSDLTNNIAGIKELTLESISTKMLKTKYNKLNPKE
ncbi:hypothetical protein MMC29_006074, partial [Sticta canariensis]|nr:hypothetical protein [Sticta canariensis]